MKPNGFLMNVVKTHNYRFFDIWKFKIGGYLISWGLKKTTRNKGYMKKKGQITTQHLVVYLLLLLKLTREEAKVNICSLII